MTWRKCVRWLPFMFLLGVMLAPLGRISYSSTTTIINVDPPMIFAEPGERFTINITIIGAVDVYLWQVNITFDPSVLQFVDAALPPDHFFAGAPQGDTGLLLSNVSDSIFPGCSLLGEGVSGKYGSGTLVTVEFEVVGTGEAVLTFDDTQPFPTMLLNHIGEPTYHGPNLRLEDGYVSNIDHPPIASFTYSPSAPVINENITFDASASYDPDGTIVRYEWDFGDGIKKMNETTTTTTHVYTTPKTYTVTLTVIDNATVTPKIQEAFNTTIIPHLWYELHSSYSAEVKFALDHDIAVVSVDASPVTVTVGKPVTINVTVENHGKNLETFNVTAYYDDSTVETITVENLTLGGSRTLELIWDTTDVTPEIYVIKAEAYLEGDENPADNLMVDGTVTVKSPQTSFPIEYVVIGVVGGGAAIGIGVFFFLRRRRTPAI